MKDTTGVTVVIPCYNAAKFLREAVESVLSQDYNGTIEVLIGEDASTDDSLGIAKSFGPPVSVLCDSDGRNRGVSAARNRCIKVATMPYVAFLDADDYWLPGHLSHLVRELQAHPHVALAYDKGYDVTADGQRISTRFREPHRPRTSPDELLLDCCFVPGNVVVRRDVFDEVGYFDETVCPSEDHDMWLRIIERFPAVHVPHYGLCYRRHQDQNSLNRRLWHAAAAVLEKARGRHAYRRSVIRRRKAVLAYHFSELAFAESRTMIGICQLAKAAFLDPLRAIREGIRRVRF